MAEQFYKKQYKKLTTAKTLEELDEVSRFIWNPENHNVWKLEQWAVISPFLSRIYKRERWYMAAVTKLHTVEAER